jgi:hypothetical protein
MPALLCIAGCPGQSGVLETPIASPSVTVNVNNEVNADARDESSAPPASSESAGTSSPPDAGPAVETFPPSEGETGDGPGNDPNVPRVDVRIPDPLLNWDFLSSQEGWRLAGGAFAVDTLPSWSIGSGKISGTGEGPWYFVSPDYLSGDRGDLYGLLLRFSLSRDTRCRDRMPGEVWEGLVVLSGNGWTIGWGAVSGSQHDFSSSLSVRLDETEVWYVVSSPDPAVSPGDRASRGVFDEVLGNLHQLRIFGQRGYCSGTTTLDNVSIE